MLPDVIAIIVTYNPDASFSANLQAIGHQVTATIIVDNSTNPDAIRLVDTAAQTAPSCQILRHGGNIGLAKAQNLGITHAMQSAPAWILMMDDDSLIAPNMIQTMLKAHRDYHAPASIGLIAPCTKEKTTGTIGRIIASKSPYKIWRTLPTDYTTVCDTALSVIASGSLINTAALQQIGLFAEKYFIDSIDIEFCLRLRSKGWKIIVAPGAAMQHELGQKDQHRFLGRVFTTSNHHAWRRYTMYRNRADVWKNYIRFFPAYVAYDILVSGYELVKIAAFEKKKSKKIRAALAGLYDGLRGHFDNANLLRHA